jgi:hypothetical protein
MTRYASKMMVSKDQNGAVIQAATVAVMLAGTATPAKIYAAAAGGVAVSSILSDDENGTFQFWVDTADYATTQLFDIYISKAVYANVAYEQSIIYNEAIFPPVPVASDGSVGLTTTQTFEDGSGTPKTMTIKNGLITAIV